MEALKAKLKARSTRSESGCLEWQGHRNKGGYGMMRYGGKLDRTHRWAFRAFKGEIPEGLLVLHSCDNPCCCDPEHLTAGTIQENNQQRCDRNRSSGGRLLGEANKAVKHSDKIKQEVIDFEGTHVAASKKFGISYITAYQWRKGIRRKTHV